MHTVVAGTAACHSAVTRLCTYLHCLPLNNRVKITLAVVFTMQHYGLRYCCRCLEYPYTVIGCDVPQTTPCLGQAVSYLPTYIPTNVHVPHVTSCWCAVDDTYICTYMCPLNTIGGIEYRLYYSTFCSYVLVLVASQHPISLPSSLPLPFPSSPLPSSLPLL